MTKAYKGAKLQPMATNGSAYKGHGNMKTVEQRICVCGCGESFRPVKAFQKFKSRDHLDQYHTAITKKARTIAKEMFARELRGRAAQA